MNGVVVGLLAALLGIGFARPRWWLGLVPVAAAVGLGAYRLAVSSSADAVAFLGIILLAVAMEGSVVAGVLGRAAFERVQGRSAGASLRAAGAVALIGVAFIGAAIVVARAPASMALLLSVAAVAVVLARVLRARLGGGVERPAPASWSAARARAEVRRPSTGYRRRVSSHRASSRGARRGSR